MKGRVAVCGAGIVGRLTAARLAHAGFPVTLYDQHQPDDRTGVSYAAAGMLSPYGERITAEPVIARLGLQALETWPQRLAEYGIDADFRRLGSLVTARHGDEALLEEFGSKIRAGAPDARVETWDREALEKECAGLGRLCSGALYYPAEGQIDNRRVMKGLAGYLSRKVDLRLGERVEVLPGGRVVGERGEDVFDLAVDCRGLGARQALPELRPVRGELLYLQTDEVGLTRPLRVLHDRFPIYVVPRKDGVYLVGATEIETKDAGPVRVQSALELLSAVYDVHPGFRQARILELVSGLRPAFFDNKPRLVLGDRLLRINGLFRHGFLLSPRMADAALAVASGKSLDRDLEELICQEGEG